MPSIDAAARINEIIDQARNIAVEQTDNAGGYANKAIAATDGLDQIDTSAGDIPFNSGQITPINLPPLALPPSLNVSGQYDGIQSGIASLLQGAFQGFVGTYLDNASYAAASQELMRTAQLAETGVRSLIDRIGHDDDARAYLHGEIHGTERAHARAQVSIEAGNAATAYLGGRYANSASATSYLLTKFAQGDAATAKLIDMIVTGGTTIPAAVENQIWQRDRGRILGETRKQKDDVIASWAGRGFPLPTGGAAMGVMMAESQGQAEIAKSSRERAIRTADIVIENIRLAAVQALQDASGAGRALMDDGSNAARVSIEDARAATTLTLDNAKDAARILLEDSLAATRALVDAAIASSTALVKLRFDAINAATDYMKALATGPQVAADVARAQVEAQSTVARTLIEYYQAQVQAGVATSNAQVAIADLQLKPAVATADNRTRLQIAAINTKVGIAEARATAALGAARGVASIAAAALSSLNASASISQNS